jgi:hypothetical protein
LPVLTSGQEADPALGVVLAVHARSQARVLEVALTQLIPREAGHDLTLGVDQDLYPTHVVALVHPIHVEDALYLHLLRRSWLIN